MTSSQIRNAALDLALERGLVRAEPRSASEDSSSTIGGDLRDFVRRELLDLETMQLLEREAELLVTGKYPEFGDEATAIASEESGLPNINPLGLFPWRDWSRFRPEVYLGEGGMGRVFRAQDVRLKRRVALKFFRVALESVAKAFLREAQSQARIDHPNVAKVFEAGEQEGIPYLSMQYVHGPTLSEAAPSLDLQDKVELVRQAALGVHAAHRLGIVHRDLKPGNILLEREEQGAWKAFVVDFGLARDLSDAPSGMTALMGTPAFMSPEQIEGPSVLVGPHSDVYALGVTLYGLLAGRLPFLGTNQAEIFRKIIEEDSPSLRKVDPSLPRELEAIVQHCMERDVLKRYDSALDLAEDLQRFLDGRPVLASPVGPWTRALKRIRRNPLPMISFSAVLLLAGGWLTYALVTRSREQDLGQRVEAQNENLTRLRSEMEELKTKQTLERKKSEDLLRQVALAQTPAERRKAEELLKASQDRERQLAQQVEETKRRLPSPATAAVPDGKNRLSAETTPSDRSPSEPVGKKMDPPDLKAEGGPERPGRTLSESDEAAYQPPQIVHQVTVQYPQRALSDPFNQYRATEVSVLLRVQVNASGQPEKITLLQGVPGSLRYNEAAVDALQRSTYAPAQRGGKSVTGTLDVRVKFAKAPR